MRSPSAALLALAFGVAACSGPQATAPSPGSSASPGGSTPAGSVDVVLDHRFSGEDVTVTLDGQVLRSGPLGQAATPAWRSRHAVSPDSHVVFIHVKTPDGRNFRSTRRILPSEIRCVYGRYDAAAPFPNNLRVETRAAC